MIANRSIPSATVIPVLVYPDVRAAVGWLSETFGFIERVRIGEDHRSQMQIGDDGAVIVVDVRGDQQPPSTASASARWRTSSATAGSSPRASATWRPRSGAA